MKPLKTEVEFATPWFQILAKTMRQGEAPYYSLKLPDYAAVVAVTEDQQVLIVRQYRPAIERYTLELPSGLIDPGETPTEAASRELLEETGYAAPAVEDLGPAVPDTGRLGNRIHTCFATGVRRIPERTPEEGIEVMTWSLDELSRAITDGTFDHSLHIASLLIAMLHGRVRLPLPRT
ncbi:MAG: hydrolase [Candidatus Solibacter sp.]|jgi:ADP-ribose pyrophosphatase|nr:hydrolase [Candidatus Solibacter sp.]